MISSQTQDKVKEKEKRGRKFKKIPSDEEETNRNRRDKTRKISVERTLSLKIKKIALSSGILRGGSALTRPRRRLNRRGGETGLEIFHRNFRAR